MSSVKAPVVWGFFPSPGKTQSNSSVIASCFVLPPDLFFLIPDFFTMYVQSYLFFFFFSSIVDEQSEVVGSLAVERYFMTKWMDVLKNKEAVIKQGTSVLKTHSGEFTNFSRIYNSLTKGMWIFND